MLLYYALGAFLAIYLLLALRKKLRNVLWTASESVGASDDDKSYKVFSRDFDVETDARKLDVAVGIRKAKASSWAALSEEFERGLATWLVRNNFAALETTSRIRAATDENILSDTIITLLVDHSGSMRGQKMLLAAGTVTVVSDLLEGLKVKQEVLGFTTVRWRGGLSRERWLRTGRPRNPGRLNDLLHVVYRSAGEPNRSRYVEMLRDAILKENIDGEAIEWAASRLRNCTETHKHLIIISDGAPVDDSTLLANGDDYLVNHLKSVIRDVTQTGDIQLSAIGINYAVDQYYQRSVVVQTPDDLGKAALDLIEQLLSANPSTSIAASSTDPAQEQKSPAGL